MKTIEVYERYYDGYGHVRKILKLGSSWKFVRKKDSCTLYVEVKHDGIRGLLGQTYFLHENWIEIEESETYVNECRA